MSVNNKHFVRTQTSKKQLHQIGNKCRSKTLVFKHPFHYNTNLFLLIVVEEKKLITYIQRPFISNYFRISTHPHPPNTLTNKYSHEQMYYLVCLFSKHIFASYHYIDTYELIQYIVL